MFTFCIHVAAQNHRFLFAPWTINAHTFIVSHTSVHGIHLSVCISRNEGKSCSQNKNEKETHNILFIYEIGTFTRDKRERRKMKRERETQWNIFTSISISLSSGVWMVWCWHNIYIHKYIRTTSICQLNKVYKYLSSVDFISRSSFVSHFCCHLSHNVLAFKMRKFYFST